MAPTDVLAEVVEMMKENVHEAFHARVLNFETRAIYAMRDTFNREKFEKEK